MKHFISRFMPKIEYRSDRRLRLIGISLVIFACAASLIGLAAFAQDTSARYGWAPYLVSTVLLMAAAYVLIPYKKTESQLESISLNVLLVGFLILALAVFMRFFRFDSMPFGAWYDEAYIGMIARNILSNPNYRPIYVTGYDHPLHFYGLVALAFKFFGDSISSIRLVTVLFGLATVVLAFLIGREAFSNRFGLIYAFLFAISRWHVTFSRFGVYTITLPFFEMLTIWLLLRARRTHQIHDFLWAGLAFGYSLNFYIGIRLFVPVMLLYIAFWIIAALRRSEKLESTSTPSWPTLLSGLVALSLAAWFAIAPIAQYALTHPDVFWSRTSQVSIFSFRDESDLPTALYSNTIKHLLMFNYIGDANGRHNLSGEPMLDPVTGMLFILGFALACSRIRQPTYSLFLILFAFNLLGGILTVDYEAPQSNRAFGTISAALFFAAVSVDTIWRRVDQSRISSPTRRLILTLVTLISFGGFIIYYNASTYFIRQSNSDRTWLEFNGIQSITAQRMLEADPNQTTIYASMYLDNNTIINFLAPQVTDSHAINPPIGLPVREPGDKPVAIFADYASTWIIDEAKQLYPNAQFRLDNTPSGKPALYSVLISPEDIQRLQGVKASYWLGDSAQGEPILTQNEKKIQVDWKNHPPVASPFIAQWETTLYTPQSGDYELILNAPAMASLWIDEEPVLNGSGKQHVIRKLAQGDHVLKVEAHSGDGLVNLQWRTPDAKGNLTAEPNPIPRNSLYLPSLVSVHGLLGNYYNGDNWSGPPAFSRIDPFLDTYFHITPLERPYSVDWSGQIEIPADGDWTFGLRINGKAQVFIDDQLVVNATEPSNNNAIDGSDPIEGKVTLKAGPHSIRIRYLDYLGSSRLHLYWTPPGEQRQIAPTDALLPYP